VLRDVLAGFNQRIRVFRLGESLRIAYKRREDEPCLLHQRAKSFEGGNPYFMPGAAESLA
jgi:hypothetical protein